MTTRMVRADVVRVLDGADALVVIGSDGAARRFDGDSAGLARAVLDLHASPMDRDALRAAVAARADVSVDALPADVLDALVRHLTDAGALVPWRDTPRAAVTARRHVVLGVSGAVAAVDAPALARMLLARGWSVQVALTRDARRFVSRDALEAITHRRPRRGIWDRDDACRVPHIELARDADAVLVYPASATTIARIAAGDCSDLVSAVAITTRAPVLVAPSMNAAMYAAPSVQRALDALRRDGMWIAHPSFGHEVADAPDARAPTLGPAAPPAVVVALLEQLLRMSPTAMPSADDWRACWATRDVTTLPWHTDALDADLAAALDALPPRARVLDVGAGDGTWAREAARRGMSVVAMEVAPAAVERGATLPGGDAVTWVVDDVRTSSLRGRFDAVLDRGCLHALAPRDHARYRATLRRLLAPGGVWVLKVHAREEPGEHGTTKFSADDLRAWAVDGLSLASLDAAEMPGPDGARRAWRAVFRRDDP